jgi:metallo-beta-lactamase family protein
MLKICFYGGVKKITGSNILVEDGSTSIILDCGLIQGIQTCELENFEPFPYDFRKIKAIFLSHAHLDHIGRLPKAFKEGFKGIIYATKPTKDLAFEILLDSLKVIRENCRFLNKEAFYDEDYLRKVVFDEKNWHLVNYNECVNVGDFKILFKNAGHILGSSFLVIFHEPSALKIVYSADLGNMPNPILKDLDPLPETDYLILESTYGNRDHENLDQRKSILEDILEDVIYQKKVLIIPAFALERIQEIVSEILDLIEKKKVPPVKIFLDSPLAERIFNIYTSYPDYLKKDLRRDLFKNIEVVYKVEEEYEMFEAEPPKIIISSSGMLTGGRMINILQRYLEDPNAILLFVTFQPEGSLGRKILEGEKEVFVEENKYKVKLEVRSIFSYSNHMDQSGIINWLKPQRGKIKEIFLFHGDEEAKKVLKHKIMDYLGIKTTIAEEKCYQIH